MKKKFPNHRSQNFLAFMEFESSLSNIQEASSERCPERVLIQADPLTLFL
jgi:hypothetical protein